MEGVDCHENYSKWLSEYYQIRFAEEDGNEATETTDILKCIRRLEIHGGNSDNDNDDEDDPGQISKKLRHMIYYHLMDLSALSFLHHRLNNESESSNFLRRFQKFLQKCVEMGQISVEHEKGFNYMINFSDNSEPSMTTFDELPSRARACIFGMKQRFLHNYGVAPFYDVQTLKEAVELEPDFYHWHLILYRKCRTERRREENHQHKREIQEPTEMEKEAILKACQLNPNHPWCLVHEILMLAELQKIRKHNWTIIEHNGMRFGTREELIVWIKAQAEEILELAPESNICVSTIAMIFTKLVKQRTENFDMIEKCLLRYLDTDPNRSKSCFNLAELYLSKKNYDAAEEYFEKAIECSPISCNLGYWACLIQILMRDPKKNGGKLEEIFEEQFNNPEWRKNDRTNPVNRFKFLQAQYLLTTSIPLKEEEAVNILCELCLESEDFLRFGEVSYQTFRFGWEHANLKLENIKEIISMEQAKAENQNDPGRRELLSKIIDKIHQAMEKESQFQRSRGRGGRGQFQRSRGGGQFQRSRGGGRGQWQNSASYSRGYRHENNSGIDDPSWR